MPTSRHCWLTWNNYNPVKMMAPPSPEPNVAGARYAAGRLIREYALTDPGRIDLEAIAWDRGVQVRSGHLEGVEAWLLRTGKHGLIRISDRIRERGRQRFSIGHELGHWELHCALSQAWLCTSGNIHAYRGSAAEVEANVFSAQLLMPDAMIRPRLARASVTFDVVRSLTEEFQTTLTATALRVVEECDQDCYVVLSQRGRIRWWKRNERRSQYFLQRGNGLPDESQAWRCEYNQVENPGLREVPARAWFPTVRRDDDVQVWEESLLSQEYQTVLTLLTIV